MYDAPGQAELTEFDETASKHRAEISPPPPAALEHIDDLAAFISASPSSYHAAAEIRARAVAAGAVELHETEPWEIGPGVRYVVVRDGSAIIFQLPDQAGPATPFTIISTHLDSPGFKLKPHSTFENHGFLQAAVEVYGSPLLNSWLDRELELAGRIATKDGMAHLVRTGPMLRIPQLAIHLDRSANENLVLDRQKHMQPIWGVDSGTPADILALLGAAHRFDDPIGPEDIVGFDVITADTQPPRVFGQGDSLFASSRLDNLLGTHCAMTAMLNTLPFDIHTVALVACFDHEEIGSNTRSGAGGTFLEHVLRRIEIALDGQVEDRLRNLAGSWHISCDVGHGVHPNYPERHDPHDQPTLGGGPILKVNANQRYATDAVSAALWNVACELAEVPHQSYVSNNDIPCGSTTGPITATRLGLRTVDCGAPILSMHSARELCAVVDPWYLTRVLTQALRRDNSVMAEIDANTYNSAYSMNL
ncbi:MAG: M18 family aminopeptidase [Cellulomonadaceae bacterium]|jgi:aspartyl aminopeptidase|nr:M18 family aminopeptidase [Cellulomonadaceae bacterium]